jgi:hypothetical protein
MVPGFPVETVREIATRHNYVELSLNEESLVISFRKKSGSTRINVYYTTQTVSTCLSHPVRGKTQLCSRNVTLEQLDLIFQDPRHHSGKGYYRNNVQQLWKSANSEFEWDSARRWRFVATASGLAHKQHELDSIADICCAWDDLFWDRTDAPNLNKTKLACGSHAALINMVADVAMELYGNVRICTRKHVLEFKAGKRRRQDIPEIYFGEGCCSTEACLEEHAEDVSKLRDHLRRLRKPVRTELVLWFIGRRFHGRSLFHDNYDMVETEYSYRVASANRVCGEFMYPSKSKGCLRHGVFSD